MKTKLSKIALWFTAVVLVLLMISQSILFIFEYELNTVEGGLFGSLKVVNKYNALDNIWFAMSSQIVSVALFTVFFIFIIKELQNNME